MTEYRVFLLRPTSYSEIFVLMADNAHAHLRNIEFSGQVVTIYLNNPFWKAILFFSKDKLYVTKYSNVNQRFGFKKNNIGENISLQKNLSKERTKPSKNQFTSEGITLFFLNVE